MNEKQKRFADFYIENPNGSESYKKAYPNCKSDATARTNAGKLLAKADIQNYIKERMEAKDNERIASQDEILEFLTDVMRGNVTDQLGLETPVKERNRAAELLAKRYGILTERISVVEDKPIINDNIK